MYAATSRTRYLKNVVAVKVGTSATSVTELRTTRKGFASYDCCSSTNNRQILPKARPDTVEPRRNISIRIVQCVRVCIRTMTANGAKMKSSQQNRKVWEEESWQDEAFKQRVALNSQIKLWAWFHLRHHLYLAAGKGAGSSCEVGHSPPRAR